MDVLHFFYKLRYAGTHKLRTTEKIFNFKASIWPLQYDSSVPWPPRLGFALVSLARFLIPLNDLIGTHTKTPTLNTRAGAGAGAGCISALAGAGVSVTGVGADTASYLCAFAASSSAKLSARAADTAGTVDPQLVE